VQVAFLGRPSGRGAKTDQDEGEPAGESAGGQAGGQAQPGADEITAELTANYWNAYTERMASVGFRDVARRFPGLVREAVRLAWDAGPRDTVVTIALNIASGVFAGYALFATTGGYWRRCSRAAPPRTGCAPRCHR
jgi:ATP-binding cassette subfamily B protein/ATP-binding cassette subfamily C protein